MGLVKITNQNEVWAGVQPVAALKRKIQVQAERLLMKTEGRKFEDQ
jgi:hypothetical protein